MLSAESESRNNYGYVVVVQDLAIQWLQSYPCETKTSQPKVIYTDNLGIWQVLWRNILESLHVNATQIRNKWDSRKSSAQSERRDICGIVAVRSWQWILDGFRGVLLLSTKYSGFFIWQEITMWKADQWYRLEQWSKITLSLRKTHRDYISLVQKCCQVYSSAMYCMRVESGKETWTHRNSQVARPFLHEVRRWSPREFVRHVVLSGDTTVLQEIGEHMTNELTEKTRSQTKTWSPLALNVSVAWKSCSSQSLVRWFHDTSFQIIMKCGVDIRKESYAYVVLSRGTTCSKIFFELTKELTALSHPRWRSRWLLRFGMDLRINLVFHHRYLFFFLHSCTMSVSLQFEGAQFPIVSFRSSSKKKNGRIRTPRQKAQCKGSENADQRWQIYIPSRRWNSQSLWRRSTSENIRDRPERGEEQEVLRGESDGLSSPTPLQDDSTQDDAEAKNDFWSIKWDFIYRHHVETSQTVRAEIRIVSHSAEVRRRYQKYKNIIGCVVGEKYWWLLETWMEKREFFRCMDRFHKIHFEGHLTDRRVLGETLTRKLTTSRPDNVWPDMWKHMSDAAKRKAKQMWIIEKPKLVASSSRNQMSNNLNVPWKTLVDSWKFRCQQQCFVKKQ